MKTTIQDIKAITSRIKMQLFEQKFHVRTEVDLKGGDRIFLQIIYRADCNSGHGKKTFHGRKWYLSEHMTTDEIVKTCYAAFDAVVKHELLEGFLVDGKALFNPHIDFEALLSVNHLTVSRS